SKLASFRVVDHLYSIIFGEAKTDSKVRRLSLAYWNILRISRSRKFAEMLDAFESHLQLTVAEHARRRVFVHAGVVGWKDRAILIPGLSHSGKTTLVERLIRAGATYYSDEYAVLELMANTVAARSQPELALTVLPKTLESARILKGVRGEAGEVVDSILD